jgi:DNA-binding response OmpR family regulator
VSLVIIADDDDLVVEIVRSTLERRGHVVGVLSDGREVKSVVELKRPDVVILDCSMDDVSGIIALRQIRASVKAFTTPVLMLTARRGAVDEDIAFAAGADDYLRKPFDPDELVVRVEALIARSAGIQAKYGVAGVAPRTRMWGVCH